MKFRELRPVWAISKCRHDITQCRNLGKREQLLALEEEAFLSANLGFEIIVSEQMHEGV